MGLGSIRFLGFRNVRIQESQSPRPVSQNARDKDGPPSFLGALFFQDNFGFPGGLFFVAVGAGYVAERGWRRQHVAELPEGNFSLRVGVGRSTHQRVLRRHVVEFGMSIVFGNDHHLNLIGQDRRGLSEGGSGAEYEEHNECSFHGFWLSSAVDKCNGLANLSAILINYLRDTTQALRNLFHI